MARYSAKERSKILRAFREFEGSQARFCIEHDIKVSTLQSWLRAQRAGKLQTRPGFVEVRSRDVTGGSMTLHSGGVEISFSSRPEPEYLAQVLRALA